MAKDKYEISLWDDVPAAKDTYLWQKEGEPESVGSEVNLVAGPGTYTCTVTFTDDSKTEVSNTSVVEVNNENNVITRHPCALTISAGTTAVFSIQTRGEVERYRWQVLYAGEQEWRNVSSNKYPSCLTNTLTFTALDRLDGYQYRCSVKFVGREELVYSEVVTLSVTDEDNVIVQHPYSKVLLPTAEDTVTLSVKVSAAEGHFEEEKIAVIGSDTMTSNCRAYEPYLIENVNGTHTFTFKMYYKYSEKGKEEILLDNPFLNLLVNERKVKVFWKDEWYDLVIKKITEDSSGKSVTYTCTDLFINELSKNGFNLEFDSELENNQGTAVELARATLEGTDWQVDEENSDIIQQFKEQPVYQVVTSADFDAVNDTLGTSIAINDGDTILVSYDSAAEQNLTCQFLYNGTNSFERDGTSQLVINADCCSVELDSWTFGEHGELQANLDGYVIFSFYLSAGVSDDYRGEFLVKKRKSIFDPLTGKYVQISIANRDDDAGRYKVDDIIYSYQSTEYQDPTIVNNLVVNNKNFATTDGWQIANIANPPIPLVFRIYPDYRDYVQEGGSLADYEAKSYLKLPAGIIYNSGLRELSRFAPNGFQYGEKYRLRLKMMSNIDGGDGPSGKYRTVQVTPSITNYDYDSDTSVITKGNTAYFRIDSSSVYPETDDETIPVWKEWELTCIKSVTRSEIYSEKVGLFLDVEAMKWLEEIEFFPEVYGQLEGEGLSLIYPGQMNKQSIAQPYYHYYNHTASSKITNTEDLNYLYIATTDWDNGDLTSIYNDDFEKIRSITIKQSNRFNILQTIAETFECWIRFRIEHDETGRTKYINGVPQKFVTIVKDVGEEKGVGFIYGIDLRSITRNIQSDQIVTKTIVSPNSNEFAPDGFCTIARSTENYPRVNYILDFGYYINQGLLSAGELNRDLYLSTDAIGYYYHLHELNTRYDSLSEFILNKRMELAKQESYQTVYENNLTSLQTRSVSLQNEILQLSKKGSWEDATEFAKNNPDHVELGVRINDWQNCQHNIATYSQMLEDIEASISFLRDTIDTKQEELDLIKESLEALDLQFYKKYSRFLQEGTWISEDYIDDNLYYLDAKSVAYTASRPQISYDISVIRISSIPEFKNKVFRCGDITYIQDTEFFGYTYIDQIKTPYREKVLVSEVHSYFDSPEKDTFKVQNYKTQFEDLFQRITATTQSLQYASGSYARAASVVETNGTIKAETLQNSIALNEQLVYSAQNEAVISDATGITVADTTNPNHKTKVTSGGVFITTDGGETWKNAIRGEGVATQYLTSGTINTNQITLFDGNFESFRWDSDGLNAFFKLNDDSGINLAKFVRFDHYGVYGIDGLEAGETNYKPANEDDIWEDAKFGMTWRGFFVKNKYGNHYVEVSSENDIQVVDKSNELNPIARVKIGKLDEDLYGMRLKDASGVTTLETTSNGQLWLQDALHIGTTQSGNYDVSIGRLASVAAGKQITYNGTNLDTRNVAGTSDTIHRSVDINNKFVVWEDGTLYAKDGYFEGIINATGGRIGNMTIDAIEAATYRVVITSSNGTTFIDGVADSKVLTATLLQGNTPVTTGLLYQWLKNGVAISGATTNQITVTSTGPNAIDTYSCIITV